MVTVKVVVVEHGREFAHTVAQAASIDAVSDVLDRLRAHFGERDGRIQIISDGRAEASI